MKKILIILALIISGCGDDGKNGTNGKSLSLTSLELLVSSTKPTSFETTIDEETFVQVPSSIFADVAHSSGSPGWMTLVLGDKTFCYFTSLNTAAASRTYNLNVVRTGNDISCTTGAATNTTYSSVQRVASGEIVRFTIHTPRIANGETVSFLLEGYGFR